MSVTWGERPENIVRSSTNPQAVTVGYVLTGVTIRSLANALAAAYSTAIYSGLYRTNIEVVHKGGGIWHVDVTYGSYERKEREDGDHKWSFSAGGGTAHVTQGLNHVASYVASGAAVDHGGAIGVNEDGEIDGTDVPDFAFEWKEDWTLLLADYGWTYAQSIVADLVNHVNDDAFRGFPAGSVCLKAAEGGQSSKDPLYVEVTFTFAYMPNVTGRTIGTISGIAKEGWEYLWVEYKTVEAAAGTNRLAKKPVQVNVEQIFYSGDFSLLGVGTT
jgi:hypothetical protein